MSLNLSMRKVHEQLEAADITPERNFRIPVSKKNVIFFVFERAGTTRLFKKSQS